jgi:hypothetical protein
MKFIEREIQACEVDEIGEGLWNRARQGVVREIQRFHAT